MSTNVRYIVNSTSDLTVYELLGFQVVMHPGPGFAALERDGVKLFLNVPGGGGGAGRAGRRRHAGTRRLEPDPGRG